MVDEKSGRVWDNSPLAPKKATVFAVAFLHVCDSLGKIELHKKHLERLSHAYSL